MTNHDFDNRYVNYVIIEWFRRINNIPTISRVIGPFDSWQKAKFYLDSHAPINGSIFYVNVP